MENPQNNPSQDSKRQLRRRKILENAKSRMDRLKNTQRSPSLIEEHSRNDHMNQRTLLGDDSRGDDSRGDDTVEDPPDEVIPKLNSVPSPLHSTPPSTQTHSVSKLASAVNAFSGNRVWRLRTALTVVCALSCVGLEVTRGVVFSSVVVLLPMDCGLLLYAVLTHYPSTSATNPLWGKLALVKFPLMLLYPAGAEWFESVCLSLLLGGLLLCDTLFTIFCIILFKIILSLVPLS